MPVRRLLELLAMLAVGDGLIALVAPRRHSLLWRFGPEGYKELMERFAERPNLVRLLAAAEIGAGLLTGVETVPGRVKTPHGSFSRGWWTLPRWRRWRREQPSGFSGSVRRQHRVHGGGGRRRSAHG